MTVHELFRNYLSALVVFIARKVLRPGCSAQAFHTLGDVVRLYGLDEESFMANLDRIVRQEGQNRKKGEKFNHKRYCQKFHEKINRKVR